ncbi:MAG: DUF523 domain-containing protein [Eggerthellaceae bacterium]|jgi:uncharacterized protein YbbK (DUF523 family)
MNHNVLISACLLGARCRYDGASKPNEVARRLFAEHRDRMVPVCPELLGGLPQPRTASEIDTSCEELRVLGAAGEDRTEAFIQGAQACRYIAEEANCRIAILKAKSPSCGSRLIYDGSFTGTLVPGNGVAAAVLQQIGITVIDERRLVQLADEGRLEDLFEKPDTVY